MTDNLPRYPFTRQRKTYEKKTEATANAPALSREQPMKPWLSYEKNG